MDKLSGARTEASSLKEQLAASKHDVDIYQKENQRLQKVLYSSDSAAQMHAAQYKQADRGFSDICLMRVVNLCEESHTALPDYMAS